MIAPTILLQYEARSLDNYVEKPQNFQCFLLNGLFVRVARCAQNRVSTLTKNKNTTVNDVNAETSSIRGCTSCQYEIQFLSTCFNFIIKHFWITDFVFKAPLP